MNFREFRNFFQKNWQKILLAFLFGFVFVLGVNQSVDFLKNSWWRVFEEIFKKDWTLFFATLASIVGVLGFLINMVDTAYKKQYEKEQMDIAKLSNKAVVVPESIEDAYFLRGENNGRNIFDLVEIIPKIEEDQEATGWKIRVYDISRNQLIFSIINIGNGLAKDLEFWLSTTINFRDDQTVYANVSYLDRGSHLLFHKTSESGLKNITFKKNLFLKIRYQSAYINEDKTEEIFELNISKNYSNGKEIFYLKFVEKIKNSQKGSNIKL